MKRILLFLITNLAVMTTIHLMVNLLGVAHYLDANGINYTSLSIYCLIVGMSGSIISLLLSKSIAKTSMNLKIIDPNHASGDLAILVSTVHRLARQAGLSGMPEVGIYDSPEPNAFATGANRNHALVAVSTGLLEKMNRDEVIGVLGHEVSHIANGDMVTMMLLMGIVNAFSMFFARMIAFLISTAVARSNKSISNTLYFTLNFVLSILLTLLGSLIVATFSRWREYRADAGGARLAGRSNMIQALQRLESLVNHMKPESQDKEAISILKISNPSRWQGLFATHPPLRARIARLKEASYV